MTAEEVKEKLRGRHPATQAMHPATMPGPWVCVEEWRGVDLLACSVHQRPPSGATSTAHYPRVGYEVKVDRGDYRRELRKPHKRVAARGFCTEFYFVVPKDLLGEVERDDVRPAGEIPKGSNLWVPEDVGLIEVDGRGCTVRRGSPIERDPAPLVAADDRRGLHDLLRWVSARPDPRHDGIVEESRRVRNEVNRQNRASRAERERIYEESLASRLGVAPA